MYSKKHRNYFHFNYHDISQLTGYSVEYLRQLVYKEKFSPYDLKSLVKFISDNMLPDKPKPAS